MEFRIQDFESNIIRRFYEVKVTWQTSLLVVGFKHNYFQYIGSLLTEVAVAFHGFGERKEEY